MSEPTWPLNATPGDVDQPSSVAGCITGSGETLTTYSTGGALQEDRCLLLNDSIRFGIGPAGSDAASHPVARPLESEFGVEPLGVRVIAGDRDLDDTSTGAAGLFDAEGDECVTDAPSHGMHRHPRRVDPSAHTSMLETGRKRHLGAADNAAMQEPNEQCRSRITLGTIDKVTKPSRLRFTSDVVQEFDDAGQVVRAGNTKVDHVGIRHAHAVASSSASAPTSAEPRSATGSPWPNSTAS